MTDNKSGFTLIEMMVILAIIGVLTAFGGRSFIDSIAKNRITTQVNEFVVTLQVARSEAVKRGATVNIIATLGDVTTDEWGEGWRIETLDGETLRVWESLKGNLTLDSIGGISQFAISSQGTMDNTDTLELCDATANTPGSQITLTITARTRIQSGINCT
ncbi:MAG: hypothetical protein COB04_08060 [Gammaproteobacteria bacterium]|nr:MAG: hypothetical protein COB04_08060 [Gammaproteobacteria bacterium]